MNKVKKFSSSDSLAHAAAAFIVKLADEAVTKTGRFTIALSGGKTPSGLYALLTKEPYVSQINWKKIVVFWGDERCVPSDDKDNNSFNAKKIFLDKIPVPAENIFPVPVELPPAEAAQQYGKTICRFFKEDKPQFDLILLGMGDNGHTASLFPHTEILHETKRLVKEVFVKEVNMWRISFTAPLINNAKHILFLVAGKEKEEMLNTILHGKYEPEKYPAQLVKGAEWFVSLNPDSG